MLPRAPSIYLLEWRCLGTLPQGVTINVRIRYNEFRVGELGAHLPRRRDCLQTPANKFGAGFDEEHLRQSLAE